MNTMFVIVYDCILNYVTACDCIHSFSSFPVVHKAKMPTLGMLMLDQKTSKKELGGFDHPGQAQRYETWVFNMNVQKDGKVKLTFMILMKVNRCSFGSRIWLSLSHCVHLTGSFSYQLKQEVVKGLTLDICHSGKLTPELEKSFTSSISTLEVPRSKNTDTPWSLSFTVKLQSPTEAAGASVICGDTGFMMWFQSLARKSTKLPVTLSWCWRERHVTACRCDTCE